MRDIVIAGLVLAGGTYAALSYAPAAAEGEVAPAPAQVEAAVAEVVANAPAVIPTPFANPWRGVPLPLSRPGSEPVTVAAEIPAPTSNASVVHAGLIEIDGERYALEGIDAPVVSQTCRTPRASLWACGTDARRAVEAFVSTRNVTCTPTGTTARDVALARCEADGVDLAEWVVGQGWAVADIGVTESYVAAERTAEADRRGLWAGWFETPSVWLAENAGAEPTRVAEADTRG